MCLTTCVVLCDARQMKACEACGGTGQLVTGAEMRARRVALGVSGADVARAMGCTRAYIHVLETGYGPHPPRWTPDVTRRYLTALATAVATKAVRTDL